MPKIGDKSGKVTETYWETTDGEKVKLYNGDVLATLKKLPSGLVQCVITSPPYWGLRSYLDSEHEHKGYELGSERSPDCEQLIEVEPGLFRKGNCAEENWEEGCHVCRMVLVFREVRRVLRDDGVCFLNYGDSYGANGQLQMVPARVAIAMQEDGWVLRQDIIWAKPSPMPESVKNRCTKAHEYVFLFAKKGGYFCDMEAVKEANTEGSIARFGLTEDGQTNTWNTTNNKIDGRTDGTKSNEAFRDYVPVGRNKRSVWKIDNEEFQQFLEWKAMNSGNKLDFWTIASESYPGAHFATFPSKLITPMIKAGTSEKGCCSECGAPWKRVIEEKKLTRERPNDFVKRTGEEGTGNSCANSVAGVETRTVGWEPSCECNGRFETVEIPAEALVEGIIPKGWAVGEGSHDRDHPNANKVPRSKLKEERGKQSKKRNGKTVSQRVYVPSIPLEEHPVSPCIVLDPFCGSGTTNAVCIALGRNSIGIELSRDYLTKNAIPRITGELLARPILSGLVPGKARKPVTFGEEL